MRCSAGPTCLRLRCFGASQATLRHVSGLFVLGTLEVNSLIGLRFVFKLMAANPEQCIRTVGVLSRRHRSCALLYRLTSSPQFDGIVIECYDLITILVNFAMAWGLTPAALDLIRGG